MLPNRSVINRYLMSSLKYLYTNKEEGGGVYTPPPSPFHVTLPGEGTISRNLSMFNQLSSFSFFLSYILVHKVSKFSKNLFREIFEAHSKIIYFLEISTIFIIIFAKFSNQFSQKYLNQFSRKFSNQFSRKLKFSRKCSEPVAHIISTWYGQETD